MKNGNPFSSWGIQITHEIEEQQEKKIDKVCEIQFQSFTWKWEWEAFEQFSAWNEILISFSIQLILLHFISNCFETVKEWMQSGMVLLLFLFGLHLILHSVQWSFPGSAFDFSSFNLSHLQSALQSHDDDQEDHSPHVLASASFHVTFSLVISVLLLPMILECLPHKFTVLVIPSSCSLLILQNERESYGKDLWVWIKAGAKALGTKRGMSDWSYIISSFSSVFSENGICSLLPWSSSHS